MEVFFIYWLAVAVVFGSYVMIGAIIGILLEIIDDRPILAILGWPLVIVIEIILEIVELVKDIIDRFN